MPKAHAMSPTEWSLLILLSLLWGGAFFLAKVALAEVGPFTAAFVRIAIAAGALCLVVRATGQRLPTDRRAWRAFAIMGLLTNAIPAALIYWGQTRIPSGLASILSAATPLWTVLVAHFFTADEKITPNRLAGVGFGLVGLVVVIGPDALRGVGGSLLAQLAVVGGGVSYAFSGVYGKRFAGTSPLVTSAGQLACSALWMVPLATIERPWMLAAPSARTWGALLVLAFLSTALASIVFFRLLATAGANNTLLVNFLIPISPLILGSAFLHERLLPQAYAGMALIALGLAAMDGRVWRQ